MTRRVLIRFPLASRDSLPAVMPERNANFASIASSDAFHPLPRAAVRGLSPRS